MKICSKEGGLVLPQFGIQFSGIDVPIEVEDEVGKIILRNPNFYEYKGKEKAQEHVVHEVKQRKVSVLKQGPSFAEIKYENEGGE